MTIGVLDSGIGGTSILRGLDNALPQHTYLYQADPKNFPFSTKSRSQLQAIAVENVQQLTDKGVELIVIACNTLTVAALPHLRQIFPHIQFIGTVPAIKKAADSLPLTATIVVLATAHTAQSTYLSELIEKHGQGQEFIVIGTTELVQAVEGKNYEQAEIILVHLLKRLSVRKHIDAVVIGCTHFSFVEKEIRQAVRYPIKMFDSIEGITKQVKKLTSS